MATKIDGKMISARIKEDLARRVAALKQRGVEPGLGTILVGSDPGSVKYVAGKHADCHQKRKQQRSYFFHRVCYLQIMIRT